MFGQTCSRKPQQKLNSVICSSISPQSHDAFPVINCHIGSRSLGKRHEASTVGFRASGRRVIGKHQAGIKVRLERGLPHLGTHHTYIYMYIIIYIYIMYVCSTLYIHRFFAYISCSWRPTHGHVTPLPRHGGTVSWFSPPPCGVVGTRKQTWMSNTITQRQMSTWMACTHIIYIYIYIHIRR